MQDLGSSQHLYFLVTSLLEVAGFPIGLGLKTMQDLGSVQNLYLFGESGYWTHED